MSYLLLRVAEGWITNGDGDFYVEDTEQKCRMWVPNNLIAFKENNEAYFKNQGNESSSVKKTINIVDISHEYTERDISDIENCDENSVQSEEITNVTENGNLEVNKIKEKRNTWSVNETSALIGAVESRYDDMHHVHKRKTFWSVISEELNSQNIERSEMTCKKKWQNLVRTYKSTKDIQSRTGRGPVKFSFYSRLDDILGDSPSNASPHSLDIDTLESQDSQFQSSNVNGDPIGSVTSSCSNGSSCAPKRKNASMELIKIKKCLLENKLEAIKQKEVTRTLYVEKSLKYKKERLDLYKEKVELEKKKLKILEDLQNILKERKQIE